MPGRIWLIGGTSESAAIATALVAEDIACTITVTTVAAQSLYPQAPQLKVLVGCLQLSQIEDFCREQQIIAVVDASHPYAVQISQSAIAAANQYNLPYLRYERPQLQSLPQANVIELDSFEQLLDGDYLHQQRVLLTVGYQALPRFQAWQQRSTLFTRILPALKSLETALQSGFTPDRVIAIRPPVSTAMEEALWQQWRICVVVTKASGGAGGEAIKRNLAAKLGTQLIVIKRPQVKYPQQTNNLSTVLAFCRQHIF